MKKSMLSVAVSSALVLVSQASFAEAGQTVNTVTDDQVITGPRDENTGNVIVATANQTIIYEGTKAETLTFNNLDTKYNSYVKAEGSNAQIVFKDLKTLNFKTDYKFSNTSKNNNNPIISSSGGSVVVQDIETVNFGTAEKSMDVDQIVHANWNGKEVVFKDIGTLNMYNNGAVMNVSSSKEDGPTATFENIGTVNIANTQSADAQYLYAAITLFGEGAETQPVLNLLTVTNVGTFNVTSNGYGILATDKLSSSSTGNQWAGHSSINASIEADNINFNTNTYAILSQKKVDSAPQELGTTTITIKANKSISLSSQSDSTIFAKSVSGTCDRNVIYLTAPTVSVTNASGTGISANKGSVNLAGDHVTISGGSQAIDVMASSALSISGASGDSSGTTTIAGNVSSAGSVSFTNQSVTQTTGTFKVTELTSDNSSLTFSTTEEGGVTIDTLNGDLALRAAPSVTEKLGSAEAAVKQIKDKILVSQNSKDELLQDLSGEASDLTSAWTYDAASDTVTNAGGTTLSPTLTAIQRTAGANLAQWRYENNHLSERLGDVRNLKGSIGAWARVYGSEAKLSDSVSTKLRADSVQVGADVRAGENWVVGGAFCYTNQDADYANGDASTDGYTLAVYGTAFFPCGGYVDLIARAGRLSTDVNASTVTEFDASYDNTAFGVSAEVGYRWDISKTFYLTPQAELSYGYVKGQDFTGSNGIRVEQDNFETLVGRLGFQAGANFADGDGTIYLTASVNHDFKGEAQAAASRGDAPSQLMAEDLGGTWASYGIGAQFNATDRWSFYGSLTRANGSDYQETFKYSVGTRFVF